LAFGGVLLDFPLTFVGFCRRLWARLCLPFINCKKLSVGNSVQLAFSSQLKAGRNSVIEIGDKANIAGNITVLGKLVIGKNAFIAPNSSIWVCENAFLSIGDFSKLMGVDFFVRERVEIGKANLLAEGTMVHDNNGHSTDAKKRKLWTMDPSYPRAWSIEDSAIEQPIRCAPVVFGENVWLGKRCIVLKGVRIGANSIAGAGSVITKSIPKNCLAAGNPAKVVKKLEPEA